MLQNNGYATSWFGKNHNTPAFQASQAGPFDQVRTFRYAPLSSGLEIVRKTEQRDELAASHYSITSLARINSDVGSRASWLRQQGPFEMLAPARGHAKGAAAYCLRQLPSLPTPERPVACFGDLQPFDFERLPPFADHVLSSRGGES
jgi:arylsulfatase A-like enzyme